MKVNKIVIFFILFKFIDVGFTQRNNGTVLDSWGKFKQEFHKKYFQEPQEIKSRKAFEDNIKMITEHNKRFEEGKYSFKIGANEYADLPNTVYLKTLVRLVPSVLEAGSENDHILGSMPADPVTVPPALDWREKGFITPPCNQGSCGSCYAYSIAHSVSGQIFKRTGKLVMLSEQQIVDCSSSMGNHGCAGGSLRNTLRYLESSAGLMRQQDYPYEAAQGKCKFISALSVVNISSWAILPPQDEQTLQTAVATIGPVAVSINASPTTFQFYSDGIYDDMSCSSAVVNHAMLVVGYTETYWILKNWWGPKWGENGYMKLKKNVNLCGLANFAAYSIV